MDKNWYGNYILIIFKYIIKEKFTFSIPDVELLIIAILVI